MSALPPTATRVEACKEFVPNLALLAVPGTASRPGSTYRATRLYNAAHKAVTDNTVADAQRTRIR